LQRRLHGRVGIYQLLTVHDELRRFIATGASNDAITRLARDGGMQPMWIDGLEKVETDRRRSRNCTVSYRGSTAPLDAKRVARHTALSWVECAF